MTPTFLELPKIRQHFLWMKIPKWCRAAFVNKNKMHFLCLEPCWKKLTSSWWLMFCSMTSNKVRVNLMKFVESIFYLGSWIHRNTEIGISYKNLKIQLMRECIRLIIKRWELWLISFSTLHKVVLSWISISMYYL